MQHIRQTIGCAALLACVALPTTSHAGIDPFIGEIMLFAGNYCPQGYLPAQGQILSIAQNTALFSILGTTYGGDGRTNFALPNLQGRSAIGSGYGAGLSPVQLGETVGTEQVTLNSAQLPAHSHSASTSVSVASVLKGSTGAGNSDSPGGKVLAKQARTNIYATGPASDNMDSSAIQSTAAATTTVNPAGNNAPVPTRSPALGLNYCIAIQGIYPPRN